MSYMQPELCKADYYSVETSHGTEVVPVEASGTVATVADLRDYLEGDPYDPDETPTMEHGWLARLSAPGYMDCTAWSAYATEKEAVEGLRESEHLCPDCDGYLDEWDECEECEAREAKAEGFAACRKDPDAFNRFFDDE